MPISVSTNTKFISQFKYYTFLSMFYCTLLIASVLLPYKIISVLGYSEPGGIFIFPITYLLGGAIAEAYGRSLAVRMVWSSIICLVIFNIIIAIIIRVPSIPTATHQEVFIQAFGPGIRLTFGCIIGLLCSDLTNVYRITKLQLIYKGKYFWQRLLWSTAISETLFNVICYVITYYGVMPNTSLLKLAWYSWLLKMIYSILMLFPLLYLMGFLKRKEGLNYCYESNVDTTSKIESIETIFLKFLKVSNLEKQSVVQ